MGFTCDNITVVNLFRCFLFSVFVLSLPSEKSGGSPADCVVFCDAALLFLGQNFGGKTEKMAGNTDLVLLRRVLPLAGTIPAIDLFMCQNN